MDIIKGIGRVSSSSVSATAVVLFAASDVSRHGVLLTNHHASKTLHVSLTHNFTTGPTISSTEKTTTVPPASTVELLVAQNVAVWVKSEDSTTINYTATEFRR